MKCPLCGFNNEKEAGFVKNVMSLFLNKIMMRIILTLKKRKMKISLLNLSQTKKLMKLKEKAKRSLDLNYSLKKL